MKENPLSLASYISLTVEEPLNRKLISNWCNTVQTIAPEGVMVNIPSTDDQGQPRNVKVIHRETKERHSYLVPVSRNLSDVEVTLIVQAFAEKHPEMDFDIETNQTQVETSKRKSISLDQAQHLALCTALAKHKHEDWMRERSGNGWRYGTKLSFKDKTHPLMLPWEHLPDHTRAPDLEWPQKLVDVLADHGYHVVSKDDFDKLLKALKQ